VAAFRWNMIGDKVNTVDSAITIYYFNGNKDVTVGMVADSTTTSLQLRFLGQTGLTSWNPPGQYEEARQTRFGKTGYFYKITGTATLTGTAGATEDLIVDTVYGIPAQKTVKPFKFPSQYKNMALLCGCTEGKEGHRVDYSMPNSADVWNGELSSMDGLQSLYFGGTDELMGGINIYNRFGASLFSSWLALKKTQTFLLNGNSPEDFKIFPISYNVGLAAPLTLTGAEMGYQMATDVNRNIALWLSYSGPALFDGAVMAPIRGIDSFFDSTESTCINFDYIDKAFAFYNQQYAEWHLLFPSGESAVCNKWVVYNLSQKRWFEIVPAKYPQCAWPVTDENGVTYIYAGCSDGFVIRLENGPTWDGTGIAQVIETGDFSLSGNVWNVDLMRRIKLIVKNINEDVNVALTHYADTDSSGTALASVNLKPGGTKRLITDTQPINLQGVFHRLKFSATTTTTEKGVQPIVWGCQYRKVRDDE